MNAPEIVTAYDVCEPEGLGEWCGYCGEKIVSPHWRSDRRACFCSRDCWSADAESQAVNGSVA